MLGATQFRILSGMAIRIARHELGGAMWPGSQSPRRRLIVLPLSTSSTSTLPGNWRKNKLEAVRSIEHAAHRRKIGVIKIGQFGCQPKDYRTGFVARISQLECRRPLLRMDRRRSRTDETQEHPMESRYAGMVLSGVRPHFGSCRASQMRVPNWNSTNATSPGWKMPEASSDPSRVIGRTPV